MSQSDNEILSAVGLYDPAMNKTEWQRTAKKYLHRLDKELGDYFGKRSPIRWNKGGPAVYGEVILHYERLYIQVSKGTLGIGGGNVLYRACSGLNDYTGLSNNFVTHTMLMSTVAFADHLRRKFSAPSSL